MSKQIFELIPKIMLEFEAVGKNIKNEKQGYMFRGIEDMYNAAHNVMAKYGVFCCPEVVGNEMETIENKETGKVSYHAVLKIRHRFYASDESFVDVITMGEGLDNSDKAINKAMSGGFKYALMELFCVPTEDIEDADRTSPEVKRAITLTKPNGQVEQEIAEIVNEMPLVEPVYIKPNERSFLARRFRETIEAHHPGLDADEHRHAALKALHIMKKYKSKLVDDNGIPTHDYILSTEYKDIGKDLIRAAKEAKAL